MTGGRAGLCHTCEHARVVRSSRGAEFYLCRLSVTDPRFPRYPSLPVLACAGYSGPPEGGLRETYPRDA